MNKTADTKRIACWLLPAKQDELLLSTIIRRLARRFDSPVFAPHLTLLAMSTQRLAEPAGSLAAAAVKTGPMTLEYTGVPQWSPVYNRALVLPFRLSPELERLVSILHPDNEPPADYEPHVSLIYANLNRAAGEMLVREIGLERRFFRFDRCAAMAVGSRCRSARDIQEWNHLATYRLRPD